jgi:hypothetical protein
VASAAAAAAVTDDAEHDPPPLPCEADFMAVNGTTTNHDLPDRSRWWRTSSTSLSSALPTVSWKLFTDHRKPERWDATDTKIAFDLSMPPGVLLRLAQLKRMYQIVPIKKPQAGRPRRVASQQ